MRQGQHGGGGAALGLLSPPSLLARFLPLGPGLQTLVRLMGASWAPGWSLGCGLFGLRLFSPLTASGALSLIARLVLLTALG